MIRPREGVHGHPRPRDRGPPSRRWPCADVAPECPAPWTAGSLARPTCPALQAQHRRGATRIHAEARLLADPAYIEAALGHDDAGRRLVCEAVGAAQRTGNPTLMLWADHQRLGRLVDGDRAAGRCAGARGAAEQLRNQMSLSWVPGFLAVLEVRSGRARAVVRFRRLVQRMLDTEGWWSWSSVDALQRVRATRTGSYRLAAMMSGQLRQARTSDRFNAGLVQPEVDLVTSLLPAEELAAHGSGRRAVTA